MRFGILGVGIMGRGIALNLAKKGHHLKLYNRTLSKIQDLGTIGTICSSPEEAWADVDFGVLCLTNDDSIRSTIAKFPENFSFPKMILDVGTTSLDCTLELQKKFSGLKFFDAPMTGSKAAAMDGQILFMLGGNEKDYELTKIFFESCGKKTVLCGNFGDGQKVKYALNMIQAGIFQTYLEGFALTKKSGASTNSLLEVLQNSGANSGILQNKILAAQSQNFEPNFSLENMFKDLQYALDLSKDVNAKLLVANSLLELYQSGVREHPEQDYCSLAKDFAKRNDLDSLF